MTRITFIARFLLCLGLIGHCSATDTWVIRFDGVGPVKIGMTLSQLNAVLHENFTSEDADNGREACFYLHLKRHPQAHLMIIDGHLARIDVEQPGVATSAGIQVGDSETRAQKVYGPQLKVEGHFYVDTGHYLTVQSKDRRYGVRFETDQGKITMFYAGRYDAIQFVEGCQ